MTEPLLLRSRLKAAATELRLELTDGNEDTLLAYLEQLQRWNRTYNLTAIRDPEQMLSHHLVDSLAIVNPLRQQLATAVCDAQLRPLANAAVLTDRVAVDVGSGAGLPGVVLAIMHPELAVHCVDTVEKKATFIRYVAGVLKLPNLHAHHARIESLPVFDADVVVSRAFASLLDFATLAGRHVRPGGRLLAMKGKEPTDEIDALHGETSWRVRGMEPLKVPGLDAERCMLWITDQGHS